MDTSLLRDVQFTGEWLVMHFFSHFSFAESMVLPSLSLFRSWQKGCCPSKGTLSLYQRQDLLMSTQEGKWTSIIRRKAFESSSDTRWERGHPILEPHSFLFRDHYSVCFKRRKNKNVWSKSISKEIERRDIKVTEREGREEGIKVGGGWVFDRQRPRDNTVVNAWNGVKREETLLSLSLSFSFPDTRWRTCSSYIEWNPIKREPDSWVKHPDTRGERSRNHRVHRMREQYSTQKKTMNTTTGGSIACFFPQQKRPIEEMPGSSQARRTGRREKKNCRAATFKAHFSGHDNNERSMTMKSQERREIPRKRQEKRGFSPSHSPRGSILLPAALRW